MVVITNMLLNNFENDPLVKKICNLLMRHGKKTKAEFILKQLFISLHDNYPGQSLNVLYLAVFNLQNFSDIRLRLQSKKFRRPNSIKNSGTPYFISSKRSQNMCIRAIFILSIKSNSSKFLYKSLSQEIIFAATNKSELLLKRFNSHNLTRLNKRYYKYKWKRKLPFNLEQTVR